MIERRRASANRDDASLGQEDVDVGIDDLVGSKLGNLGHDEYVVGIEIQLGRLGVAHRILDRQLVQPEAVLEQRDLAVVGIDDVDPHKAMVERWTGRSDEHKSELQSLMRISYAVFCLKKTTQVN